MEAAEKQQNGEAMSVVECQGLLTDVSKVREKK
jgi:hypothetical protein